MPRTGLALTVVAGLIVAAGAASPAAQSPASSGEGPRFEVASIKGGMSPAEAGRAAAGGGFSFAFSGLRVQPGGRLAGVANLQTLILRAYGIREYQLEGGPAWLTTDYFDLSAKAEKETATEAELNEMLKSLLAERFGLRVHVETRETSVFTLVLARDDGRFGPALKRTSPECEATLEERKRTGAPAPPLSGRPSLTTPECGMTSMGVTPRRALATYLMGGRPIADLVSRLSSELKAPVIDRTGLTGLFDVVLEYESTRRFAGQPPGPDLNSTDPLPVPLPAALQQQLGFRLEKQIGPLAITIVDAANHPSPN